MLVLQPLAGMIPSENMGALFGDLIAASAVPAFEKLIRSINRVSQLPSEVHPQLQGELTQGLTKCLLTI